VEAGCGTGETSIRIRKCAFIRVGLDISPEALKRAKSQQTYDHYILADIFNLPFKEESVDGVWNVGVMEHFNLTELFRVFEGFNSVLKPTGCCLFFWPWILAPSHVIFRLYEMMMHRFGHDRQIFPSAPSMFSNRLLPVLYKINKNYGFAKTRFHFPWLDLTHFAVVVIKR
jgi:SAM-dependent methyltransferase